MALDTIFLLASRGQLNKPCTLILAVCQLNSKNKSTKPVVVILVEKLLKNESKNDTGSVLSVNTTVFI